MKDSKIQWTDHTWNVARGCTKVDEDCKYCYMYRDSMNGTRYEPKDIIRTKTVFDLPLRIKEPAKIFTSSLTDFFHEAIDPYRDEAWDIIRRCPQHIFQILTKRPERINFNLPPDWGRGWKNVWLGTSIGHQGGIRRMYHLLKAPTLTRFLSLEPLHGKLSIQNHYGYRTFGPVCSSCSGNGYYSDNFKTPCPECNRSGINPAPIHWVIVGGESGNNIGKYQYRECELEWITAIVKECKAAGVPVFVKQLGTHLAKQLKLKDRHGGDITEWPEELQVREMPD